MGCAGLTRRHFLQAAGVAALAAGCTSAGPTNSRATSASAPRATAAVSSAASPSVVPDDLSVDLHAHPGMLQISPLDLDVQIARMAAGGVSAVVFAAVADLPVLGVRARGGIYATRRARPGELHAATYRQLAPIHDRIASGRLAPVLTAADLDATRTGGRPGAILGTEGADFLEGRLERVTEAHERGIRVVQLVHYRINELGDIQTEDATHGGLTPFGRDVIRELNRLGMLIDLAHATLADVRAAVETSTVPMILSHTNLQNASGWARFISPEHARLLGEHGGVVGAMPIALGAPGFGGFIDNIGRLVDTVGVDHVAIGTDMDGIIPARLATFDDYAEWASIATALRARGFGRDEVARVLGGNFARVFRVATGRAGA
jgi:membrane dipeptidase